MLKTGTVCMFTLSHLSARKNLLTLGNVADCIEKGSPHSFPSVCLCSNRLSELQDSSLSLTQVTNLQLKQNLGCVYSLLQETMYFNDSSVQFCHKSCKAKVGTAWTAEEKYLMILSVVLRAFCDSLPTSPFKTHLCTPKHMITVRLFLCTSLLSCVVCTIHGLLLKYLEYRYRMYHQK